MLILAVCLSQMGGSLAAGRGAIPQYLSTGCRCNVGWARDSRRISPQIVFCQRPEATICREIDLKITCRNPSPKFESLPVDLDLALLESQPILLTRSNLTYHGSQHLYIIYKEKSGLLAVP